jgi:hypothetical protein
MNIALYKGFSARHAQLDRRGLGAAAVLFGWFGMDASGMRDLAKTE